MASDQLANMSSLCYWPQDQPVVYNEQNYPVKYFELVLYPVLLAICTIGNIITITVLSTDTAKTTTNVYLICVAGADIFILWLNLPEYIITATNEKILEDPQFVVNYQNYFGLGKWVSETCVQFSDWTLIIFSLERFLAVARPFQFQTWRTVPVAIGTEIVVLFLASVFTLQNLVSWYYMIAHDDGTSSANQIFPPALTEWGVIQNQAEIGITIAKWLALIVITTIFMVVLAKQTAMRKNVLRHHSSAAANQKSSNYILVASVALYFFTQLPNVIYKCLEVASKPPYCTYNLTRRERTIARPFILIATLSNYSLDFLVYCAVSKKFRGQLAALLSRVLGFCCPAFTNSYSDLDTRRQSTATVLTGLTASKNGSLAANHSKTLANKPMAGKSISSQIKNELFTISYNPKTDSVSGV